MRPMQGTRAHGQCLQPPTGICSKSKTYIEAATTPSTSGSKAAGTRRRTTLRNLRTRQRPRIQMDLRQLRRARERRRRQCYKVSGMLSRKGKQTGTDPAATSKSVLPKMKASWDQTFQRAAETGATLAFSQHTKEVIEKAAKLEEDIHSLGKLEGQKSKQLSSGKKRAESTPTEAPITHSR